MAYGDNVSAQIFTAAFLASRGYNKSSLADRNKVAVDGFPFFPSTDYSVIDCSGEVSSDYPARLISFTFNKAVDIEVGMVVEITDSTNADLNGRFRVCEKTPDNKKIYFAKKPVSLPSDLGGSRITNYGSNIKFHIPSIGLSRKSGATGHTYQLKGINYNVTTDIPSYIYWDADYIGVNSTDADIDVNTPARIVTIRLSDRGIKAIVGDGYSFLIFDYDHRKLAPNVFFTFNEQDVIFRMGTSTLSSTTTLYNPYVFNTLYKQYNDKTIPAIICKNQNDYRYTRFVNFNANADRNIFALSPQSYRGVAVSTITNYTYPWCVVSYMPTMLLKLPACVSAITIEPSLFNEGAHFTNNKVLYSLGKDETLDMPAIISLEDAAFDNVFVTKEWK